MKTTIAVNQKISIIETPTPTLEDYGNKGAIIKVLGCGLCGSDIVKFLHDTSEKTLGHEVVGEIVEIKNGIFSEFKKGDKVVLGHHVPCLNCDYCNNGNYSRIINFTITFFCLKVCYNAFKVVFNQPILNHINFCF